jgi:hypothetical protein
VCYESIERWGGEGEGKKRNMPCAEIRTCKPMSSLVGRRYVPGEVNFIPLSYARFTFHFTQLDPVLSLRCSIR